MAKLGFAYYASDTDKFQDIRIKRLKKELGGIGFAVYDYILCEIYRVRGCCLEWDESTTFDVAEYWGIKESSVNEIVTYCCHVGLFDKELLSSGSLLSSNAILRRYVDMCRRAKREAKIPEKLSILLEKTVKLPEKTSKIPRNCDKEKESKEKERKEKERERARESHVFPLLSPERDLLITFADIDSDLPQAVYRQPLDDHIWQAAEVMRKNLKCPISGESFHKALRMACDNLKSEEWFYKSGNLYWLLDVKAGKYNGENARVRIAKHMKEINGFSTRKQSDNARPLPTYRPKETRVAKL